MNSLVLYEENKIKAKSIKYSLYAFTGNFDSNNLEYALQRESFRYSDYLNFSQVKTAQNNYIENYSPDYKVIQGLQRATKILLTVHIFEQIRKHVILKQSSQEVPFSISSDCHMQSSVQYQAMKSVKNLRGR